MNVFARIGRTRAVTGVVALLAGCALGGMAPSHPATAAQLNALVVSAHLGGEGLTASQVKVVSSGCFGDHQQARFTANGTATGAYPGTFSSTGGWAISAFGGWDFAESFTITSNPYTIAGSMSFRGVQLPGFIDCTSLYQPHSFAYAGTVTVRGKIIKRVSGRHATRFR
jgi:hypothetical protein